MNWIAIAWIAVTILIITYALRKMIDREEQRKREESEQFVARLAQENEDHERERNMRLRREGKIW